MNPHAAEFVPSQPWVPNGYPVSPPNGYLSSPNGFPVMPNEYSPSLNGSQDGFSASATESVESPGTVIVDAVAESNVVSIGDEKSSVETGEKQRPVEEKSTEQQSVHSGNTHPVVTEDEATDVATPEAGKTADLAKEICNEKLVEEKPTRCWGDYSDSEAEIVEVSS